MNTINQNGVLLTIFLDLFKTFVSVDQEICLKKLYNYIFRGKIMDGSALFQEIPNLEKKTSNILLQPM